MIPATQAFMVAMAVLCAADGDVLGAVCALVSAGMISVIQKVLVS